MTAPNEDDNYSTPIPPKNKSGLAHLIRTKRLSTANRQLFEGVFLALFILTVGLVAILSYYYLFWFIAVIGLATLFSLWRFKDDDTILSALCFMSVFVFLYGLIGILIQHL